ncbi:hypothetical protein [Micromonospora sp. NPDC005367]|uniref:hypothetical protein n=1 Tax=Micromonospora sp. NPDC005367 TaxID=3155590 RepID=UPI0033A249C3
MREELVFRRGLEATQVGSPRTRGDMERLGFYVCVKDLEDELIDALGTEEIEAAVARDRPPRPLDALLSAV